MDGTKRWYESTGVIGGLVAVGGALANVFGVPMAPTDQAALVGHVTAAVGAVGGIIAIVGRWTATKKIG